MNESLVQLKNEVDHVNAHQKLFKNHMEINFRLENSILKESLTLPSKT